MRANLHVRNLDRDLVARLKRRAARHGKLNRGRAPGNPPLGPCGRSGALAVTFNPFRVKVYGLIREVSGARGGKVFASKGVVTRTGACWLDDR